MRMKILVPVDFSATAADALRYTIRLAALYYPEASISAAHAFLPQVDMEYPNFVPPMKEFLEARYKMLQQWVEETLGSVATQNLGLELWTGFPADEIIRRSVAFDCIVMGTTGESSALAKALGSVSTAVTQRASCPVWLIPSGVAFQPLERILYASHYDAVNEQMLGQLLVFNRVFGASIHFVHVKDARSPEFAAWKEQILSALFKAQEPEFAFEIAELEGEEPVEALIKQYAAQHHIHLIAWATRHRDFLQLIFHKSHTRRFIRTAQCPMLVLHAP